MVTSTTTTTTLAVSRYYWGWKSTSSILTEAQIVASTYTNTAILGADLTADYSGGVGSPQYFWFAELSSEPLKTKW